MDTPGPWRAGGLGGLVRGHCVTVLVLREGWDLPVSDTRGAGFLGV